MEEYQGIKILYIDNHVLVVVKPINMPVCEDSSKDIDLLSLLKEYVKEKYNKQGNVYLGLVHRLDRPVGGVMVFARTSKAASRLSKQVSSHMLSKVYYACVEGYISNKGTFIDYLCKNSKKNISYVTSKDKGKYSELSYNLVDFKDNVSLIRIKLKTGRSHQIRVQFSSRGYPLIGDSKYNGKCNKYLCLYSKELVFIHPTTKEELRFSYSLPNIYPYNIFKNI